MRGMKKLIQRLRSNPWSLFLNIGGHWNVI
nr:MAG TPA: hypothetical protein [Caudoviricetes sp.]DAL99559.1 MAG TPA: hypothetical protein [Caudoviricetes sp.]DAT38247.1 MAG TPA: hypothetical protein [Caudoviricetes sp.]